MRKRALIAGASGVAAAVLLVGYVGLGTAPDGGGRAGDHPCRRITTHDLETVVAAPVKLDRHQVGNGGQICRWSYPLPAGREGLATALWPTSSIAVGVWRGRIYYAPDAVEEEFTAVPGIADAAHVSWPTFITFRKGETVVVIENREGFDLHRRADDDLPRWRALATLIASRY